jgi:hypothetical protein
VPVLPDCHDRVPYGRVTDQGGLDLAGFDPVASHLYLEVIPAEMHQTAVRQHPAQVPGGSEQLVIEAFATANSGDGSNGIRRLCTLRFRGILRMRHSV